MRETRCAPLVAPPPPIPTQLRVADGATPPIEAIAPIQNKVGAFLADPTLHRILTRPEQLLHLRKIMDDGQVLSVNLAKGELGEYAAELLGRLLSTTIGLAAFSRAEISEAARRDFFLYIDEFQNFTTRSIANMTSELRKYRVAAVLAHQYLHQLEPEIRDAILGNVGTLVSFRLGPADAEFIAKESPPKIEPIDLLNLPNHHIHLKLMMTARPPSRSAPKPWRLRRLPRCGNSRRVWSLMARVLGERRSSRAKPAAPAVFAALDGGGSSQR